MNKETEFVIDLIKRTKKKELTWSNISYGPYSDFIIQPNFVFQAFSSQLVKGKKKYVLLLVHKKIPTMHEEFEIVHENLFSELLVLFENRLINTISTYKVEDTYFDKLTELVEENNQDSKDLFDGYDSTDDYDF